MIFKVRCILFLLFQLLFFGCSAQSHLIEHEIETVIVEKIKYYLYYPKDYEADKNKKFGILLFLHGSGDIPSEVGQSIPPPKLLTDGTEFPFLILVPQLLDAKKMWNTRSVMQLLDTVVENNRIDSKKIYLSGVSRGAAAAWNLVVEYPNTFAALAVVCGMAPTPYANWIDKDLPIWVFHGEEDKSIPISESKNMVNRLLQMNYNVKFTWYKGAGHNIWDTVYTNSELYNWLNSQKKM
tara:strand:- start:18362 stop:19075 length:714 start_codon:yes stop_codon:yes gene_type:complete